MEIHVSLPWMGDREKLKDTSKVEVVLITYQVILIHTYLHTCICIYMLHTYIHVDTYIHTCTCTSMQGVLYETNMMCSIACLYSMSVFLYYLYYSM